MFSSDPSITDLKVRERSLYKALFSTNIHQVATPELSAEDARCYILFFREGAGLSACIALYFLRTDRKMYYPWSQNPFPPDAIAEVEGEARGFVEDMGFVLDEINFAGLSLDEKNRWIGEQDLFAEKKQPEAKPGTPAATLQQEKSAAPEGAAKTAPATPKPPQAPAQAVQTAAPQPRAAAPAPEPEPQPAAKRPDELLQQGIRAGVVKPPASQLKKEIRSASGVVGRDREALARLLASF